MNIINLKSLSTKNINEKKFNKELSNISDNDLLAHLTSVRLV
ncbi:hypothetical protein ACQRC6_00930 [Peptoniphilus sp. SGI.035]